ncbi:hypothetical protein H5410_046552, partial [Solanum commersonii]
RGQVSFFRGGFFLGFDGGLKKPPTDALRPIIPDNTCILCITAASCTELADAYSPDTVITSSPGKEVHDPWAFYLHMALLSYGVLAAISRYCSPPKGRFLRVTHPSATGNTVSRVSHLTCMVNKLNTTILEQLGAGPSFRTITDMKIMVKIGFNCQLPLSEIGLTTAFEGTGVTSLFHSRVLMHFHAPLRPRKMDKFLFLGKHTRFFTTKRIMVTLQLTTSFMNFIVIEIHVLPRQNLELAILLPSRQRLTSVERMIHLDRHESPTTLQESMLYISKRLTSLLLSWYTPLPAKPLFSSVHKDKM